MPTDPSLRMTIEDVFRIRGRGTVVTGRIECGTLQVGDTVEIKSQSGVQSTVVTGIEAFRKRIDQAGAGDMVGVFLQGMDKEELQRGDVLMGAESGSGWDR